MTIVKEYLDYTEKWKKEYGEKTLVLMQVGSFFESYGLLDKDNNIPDEFRKYCIIPVVKYIVSESNRLIEYQDNFEFLYDTSINIDDIRFIRARLAFSFEDFSADEFHISGADEEEDYPIHELEICMINELTDECIELGLDVYCEESYPNIPVEDFLGCLSSFYTP